MKFYQVLLIGTIFVMSCKKPESCFFIDSSSDVYKVNQGLKIISCSLEAKKYNWQFGDGSTQNDAGPQVRHSYNEPGMYTITLEVLNGTSKAQSSQTITVQ